MIVRSNFDKSQRTTTLALTMIAILAAMILVSSPIQSAFALSAVTLKDGSRTAVVQHVYNGDDTTLTIDNITLYVEKNNAKTNGELKIQILQDNNVVAQDKIAIDKDIHAKKKTKVTAEFDDVQVTGNFDVKVSYDGKGVVHVIKEKAKKSSFDGKLEGKGVPKNYNLKMTINAESSEDDNNSSNNPPPSPPPALMGKISYYAYRIPSQYWGNTFVDSNAQMYFLLYNSEFQLIDTGFSDENGNTFANLQAGATYYIVPTDCNACHGGTHDVAFNHWENNSTDRARTIIAQEDTAASVGAYFEYIPHDEQAP